MVKQNRFNRLIHVGSILFAGAMYHGMDTSRTDSGGLPGTESLLSGYTLISPESVHSPLDCLYGIKDPEKAKEVAGAKGPADIENKTGESVIPKFKRTFFTCITHTGNPHAVKKR